MNVIDFRNAPYLSDEQKKEALSILTGKRFKILSDNRVDGTLTAARLVRETAEYFGAAHDDVHHDVFVSIHAGRVLPYQFCIGSDAPNIALVEESTAPDLTIRILISMCYFIQIKDSGTPLPENRDSELRLESASLARTQAWKVLKTKAGLGLMLWAMFGFFVLKIQSGGSLTEWMGGTMYWIDVGAYMVGGALVASGLKDASSLDAQWLTTFGLIGITTGIGAGLTAAIISNDRIVGRAAEWPVIMAFVVIAAVGFYISWTALNARMHK